MKKSLHIIAGLVLSGSLALASTVATVNGEKITEEEIAPILMQLTQGQFAQMKPSEQEYLRTKVIEQKIAQKLATMAAKEQKLDQSAQYKADLEKAYARAKADLEEKLLANYWIKSQDDQIQVTEAEAKAFYDQNKDQFVEPELVHARHILIKTDSMSDADALAKIKEVQAELKGKSGDALKELFIKLAKEKSMGPSNKSGGDLGYFKRGAMVPAFNDAVFAMKVGTVSDIVKTNFGYHLIYLEDKKEPKAVTFDLVKGMLIQKLRAEKAQKVISQKIEELKKSAKITY
jgi:peptidyl-prolyl cis-trans isomerase C